LGKSPNLTYRFNPVREIGRENPDGFSRALNDYDTNFIKQISLFHQGTFGKRNGMPLALRHPN
jgi:hypothetical protein